MNLIFIYGTLKRGMINNSFMDDIDASFVDTATTSEAYPLIRPWGLPYLLNLPGTGHQVKGELWLVHDDYIPNLDSLEGVPHHYDRMGILVEAFGKTVLAQTYFKSNIPEDQTEYLEEYTEND